MAKLPGAFNADDHQEMEDFSVLPPNDYHVAIVDSDYLENSAGTGHYLKLVREVQSGEFKGRKIFSNLNLDNPNHTAVEIAQKEFTSTCKACGKVVVEDSEELHGIDHMVKLTIRKGKGDNPDQNNIQKIWAMEGVKSPEKPGKAATPTAARKKKRPVFEDDE